jgi:hypothetical protein
LIDVLIDVDCNEASTAQQAFGVLINASDAMGGGKLSWVTSTFVTGSFNLTKSISTGIIFSSYIQYGTNHCDSLHVSTQRSQCVLSIAA